MPLIILLCRSGSMNEARMRVQETDARKSPASAVSEARHRLHEGTKSSHQSTPSVEIPHRSSTIPSLATSVPNTATRSKAFGVGDAISSSLSRNISSTAQQPLQKPSSTSLKSVAKEDYDETKNPFADESTNPFGEDDDYNDSLNPFSEWFVPFLLCSY